MIGLLGALAQPLLLKFEPERAHRLTILSLKAAALLPARHADRRLATRVFGLDFPNPIGMAAGFDKGAEVPDAMLRLGLGFTEIGTVTPLPQPGNPRPRLFRLPADGGVINRFGFNSEGHTAVHARLRRRAAAGGIVGVNLGANKDATDRAADYVAGVAAFADVASYFAINVSSPNTPGLRDLQQAAALDDLLVRVIEARDRATALHSRRPVLLKIAPDVSEADLDDIVRVARDRAIDGMIVGNTTLSRPPGLRNKEQAAEAGGLSGQPLFALSTQKLAATFLRVEGQFPLVGVGGVDSAASALAKIEAGASLVQLYTALVYRGPRLIDEIESGLVAALPAAGQGGLASLVGMSAADWAAGRAGVTV